MLRIDGISATQSLLWLCVDGFSPDERAMLDEHASSPRRLVLAPPQPPAEAPLILPAQITRGYVPPRHSERSCRFTWSGCRISLN
jgi:hypothetical protein